MPVAAAIAGSAIIGASSASKAAKAQSRAADQQLQVQREMYDQTRKDLSGYRDAGEIARQAYLYEMGLGPAPTIGGTAPEITTATIAGTPNGQPTMRDQILGGLTGNQDTRDALLRGTGGATPDRTVYRAGGQEFASMEEAQKWANANPTGGTAYGGFTATPGYQFRVDQGNDSINALAGSRGGLFSGKTLQDLSSFNQNIASEEYGSYMGKLAGLTDMGSSAAAGQAGANNAFAAGASNAYGAKGNAAAAGAIGVGNALNSGIQTGIGLWQYQQGLDKGFVPQGWTR